MKQLITDEAIEAAFTYLRDGAEVAAQAKADVSIADFRVEKAFSELLLQAPKGLAADLRKAWAKSQPEYEKAVILAAECEKQLEWHKRLLMQAQATIDAWRTQSSSERYLGRMG